MTKRPGYILISLFMILACSAEDPVGTEATQVGVSPSESIGESTSNESTLPRFDSCPVRGSADKVACSFSSKKSGLSTELLGEVVDPERNDLTINLSDTTDPAPATSYDYPLDGPNYVILSVKNDLKGGESVMLVLDISRESDASCLSRGASLFLVRADGSCSVYGAVSGNISMDQWDDSLLQGEFHLELLEGTVTGAFSIRTPVKFSL